MGKYDLSENNELHKKTIYKFPTRSVLSSFPNQYWSIDLVDMSKRADGDYKYIFNMEDVFSRKLFSYPLKSKTTEELKKALQTAFIEHGKPRKLWVDKEGGIISSNMQNWLHGVGVETYHTYGRGKSALVESLQRTQKQVIEKEINGGRNWLSYVQPFATKYNAVKHSRTGATPNDAFLGKDKGAALSNNLLNGMIKKKEGNLLNIGDRVRLQIKKGKLDKGYAQRWTDEIFTVIKVKSTNPTTYTIKDDEGNEIVGGFYSQELQRVKR